MTKPVCKIYSIRSRWDNHGVPRVRHAMRKGFRRPSNDARRTDGRRDTLLIRED